MATEAGIDCCVINGENPELLYDLLEGREIGTRFVAKKKDKKPLSQRRN